MLSTNEIKIKPKSTIFYSEILNALMVNDIAFMYSPKDGVLIIYYQYNEYDVDEHKYVDLAEENVKEILANERLTTDMYEFVK